MNHITLEQLQTEVSEWSQRNFPNNKPHHPLLGLVEEHGELRDAKTIGEVCDAIGDVMIYLADYCGRNKLQLIDGDAINVADDLALYRLCHFHLKREQGIRHTPEECACGQQACVNHIVSTMKLRCADEHIDFYAVITDTWNRVKVRDWQKNPIAAAKIAEGGVQ